MKVQKESSVFLKTEFIREFKPLGPDYRICDSTNLDFKKINKKTPHHFIYYIQIARRLDKSLIALPALSMVTIILN